MAQGLGRYLPSVAQAVSIAAAARAGLVLYTVLCDHIGAAQFTDVDYLVFSDAARLISEGRSPYLRATYRYTPLLAALLAPILLVHAAAGKVLFCLGDLCAARLLQQILLHQGASAIQVQQALLLWLANPFVFAVSARGSADSMTAALQLLVLWWLLNGQISMAAAAYGLLVHWRLYPIIHALPLLLVLRSDKPACLGLPISTRQVRFSLISAATCTALCVLCYWQYGWDFVEHAYLHHLGRKDFKHSFSPFFYSSYLGMAASQPALGLGRLVSASSKLMQASLVMAAGWQLSDHLCLAFLMQTILFVAFNQVCTAQYFVWYFSLLPLVVPWLKGPRWRWVAVSGCWALTQLNWLFWAYQLEFNGSAVYLQVQLSSLAFFGASVGGAIVILRSFCPSTSFRDQMHLYKGQDAVSSLRRTKQS